MCGMPVRLVEERLLKALIKRQGAMVKTPAEIQARINVALDRLDRGSMPRRVGAAAMREIEPAAHLDTAGCGGDALRGAV